MMLYGLQDECVNGCVAILTQWLTINVYVSRLHAAKSHAFHIILSTHIGIWVRVGWAVMGCPRWVVFVLLRVQWLNSATRGRYIGLI